MYKMGHLESDVYTSWGLGTKRQSTKSREQVEKHRLSVNCIKGSTLNN